MKAFEKFTKASVSAPVTLAIAVAMGLGGSVYAAAQSGRIAPVSALSTAQAVKAAANQIVVGNDTYKEEAGKVYELEDNGTWEVEADKKIENGKVYEKEDNGTWVEEVDRQTQAAVDKVAADKTAADKAAADKAAADKAAAEKAAAEKAAAEKAAAEQAAAQAAAQQQAPAPAAPAPQAPAGTTVISGDDYYKEEAGTVYEYDDGRWEAEPDKQISGGTVYEYDDGAWEAEDNDWDDHEDYDDDWDDHDDYDDDWDDDDHDDD